MTHITHEVAALACELLDCGACHSWAEALNEASALLLDLGRYTIEWDSQVAERAWLAHDYETANAASPF